MPKPESRIPAPRAPAPDSRTRLNAIVDVEAAERCGWTPPISPGPFSPAGPDSCNCAQTSDRLRFSRYAKAIVELARPFGAMVIVNDRADIARLSGAGGVHVGQEDLSPRRGSTARGCGRRHRPVHAHGGAARAGARRTGQLRRDRTGVWHDTKHTGYDAIGLERVAGAARRTTARGLPLVAIGGITLERAASVVAAGATSVAVIGDLLATGDPEGQTRNFLRVLNKRHMT